MGSKIKTSIAHYTNKTGHTNSPRPSQFQSDIHCNNNVRLYVTASRSKWHAYWLWFAELSEPCDLQ